MDEEKELKVATVCFPLQSDMVLLARKTTKIGAGCWNGYGGGVELGESILQAAVRELFEESGLVASEQDLTKVAVMDFQNTKKNNETFVVRVHYFTLTKWSGEVRATSEMSDPTWFYQNDLPLGEMMPGDKFWLPKIFEGKKIAGTAHYGPYQKEILKPVAYKEVTQFAPE